VVQTSWLTGKEGKSIFKRSYTDKINFWERMHNTVLGTFKHVGRQLIHLPRQNAALHKYFNYTDSLPPVRELEYETALILLNTHYSLRYSIHLMPNYVQFGGMHVKPPKKIPQVRIGKKYFRFV
jgi:glucuronosyltransferase